jgi:hypothetical protein
MDICVPIFMPMYLYQVVAGLNYKLSILTYVHGKCQGSLEDVVVYRDLNQTYSVSHWGTLKQCDDIVFPE